MIKLMEHTFFKVCNVEEKLSKFILNNARLSMGEFTLNFEKDFAKWHSRNYCVMVNSGSSANLVLIASLMNLGRLKRGDKIGVSAVTWSTNLAPLIQLGLEPVLIDVGVDDVNVNSVELSRVLPSLSAVFVTNVLGLDNDLEAIKSLCEANDLILIEDNCEALGCTEGSTLFGNFGLASTSSSFVGHHLSTIEGGYIFTDDPELHAMAKVVRAHGWSRNLSDDERELLRCFPTDAFSAGYTFDYCGFNVRPSEINAFCGLEQLPKLDFFNKIRSERFIVAAEMLGDLVYRKESRNPIFAIPIRAPSIEKRQFISEKLNENLIEQAYCVWLNG